MVRFIRVITPLLVLIPVLFSLPAAVIKYPDKRNLKKKRFILVNNSLLLSIMARKSEHEEHQVAGYITSTAKKQQGMLVF